jgi:hypothetical protein
VNGVSERLTGLGVGAAFGTAFVLANAHPPLGENVRLGLRVAIVGVDVALLLLIALAARRRRVHSDVGPARTRVTGAWFGRSFLWVVTAELFVLVAGLQLLRALGAPTQANVAWIALVVGLHFVAFAVIWKEKSIAIPGWLLFALGVAGLVMSDTGALRWVPLVSGVASGCALLIGSLVFSARELSRTSA